MQQAEKLRGWVHKRWQPKGQSTRGSIKVSTDTGAPRMKPETCIAVAISLGMTFWDSLGLPLHEPTQILEQMFENPAGMLILHPGGNVTFVEQVD